MGYGGGRSSDVIRATHSREDSDEGWAKFTVKVESNSDVREEIAAMALKQNWRIRELSKKSASLEDVFVELTHADMTH